jgi:hypothetical protein
MIEGTLNLPVLFLQNRGFIGFGILRRLGIDFELTHGTSGIGNGFHDIGM